jgi:threonine dehydrogenase-like Zn-dependent dehydrogenase
VTATLPASGRAVVYTGGSPSTQVRVRPLPPVGEQDVLVRVLLAGVCASDRALVASGAGIEPGATLGHELVGEVMAGGASVRSVREGDRVTCLAFAGCAACAACQAGAPAHCSDRTFVRQAYGQYAVVPASACWTVPVGVATDVAVLTEPLAVAVHAVDRAPGIEGRTIAVVGAGPVGLLVALVARQRGAARVVVVAPSARSAELVLGVGADPLVHGAHGAGPAASARQAPGGDVPVVLDCAGAADSLDLSLSLLGLGGCVVAVGAAERSTVAGKLALRRESEVRWSLAYGAADFDEAVRLLSPLGPALADVVGERIGLSDVPSALAGDAGGRPGRTVVEPWTS